MPIDDAHFKLAMSHFASGVTVVTTSHEGRQYGMTVASFASLSLHPPLVLVCIERSVKTHDAIAASGKFGVSILSSAQADISSTFASRSDDKFTGIELVPGDLDVPLNVPLIKGALTAIECRVYDRLPGGDHTIFIGEVMKIHTTEGDPLLYFRSGYREMRS
jgi:flavin reductase (DIM6/NTAB) family NADH-FMN oxidoreductase RutF